MMVVATDNDSGSDVCVFGGNDLGLSNGQETCTIQCQNIVKKIRE